MLSETEEKEAMDGHRTIEIVDPLSKLKETVATANIVYFNTSNRIGAGFYIPRRPLLHTLTAAAHIH